MSDQLFPIWLKHVQGKPWLWEFRTPSNCSITALEEAAQALGPAFVYTLTVNPLAMLETRNLCRQLAATVENNPFAPYINILTSESVGRDGWMLSANGLSVGSPGVR